MLGNFAITANGKRITELSKKPSKVWRLIQYLVAHRNRAIAQEELLEIFCSDEARGNSGSVLRTMVYRARAVLDESGLECAHEIIHAKSGCYSWNNNIECTTDIEELEELTKKAAACSSEDEKLPLLLQATSLYKGDFLQGSSGDMWAVPLTRYYRGLYTNAAHEALKMLIERERLAEAEELATKALAIDPFDEDFIICYLRILIAQKKNSEALDVYKKMEAMFYDELGVDFSEELHILYDEIAQAEAPDDAPLQEVVMRWLTDSGDSHVYYCDSSDFKVLCQVEARSAARSGHTTYIVRFNTKHDPAAESHGRRGGIGVMKSLEQAISSCLRTSDIYTRYSPSQYMVMLRSLTYEDCKMLINKILSKVDARYLPRITDTSIMHVTPAGEYVQDGNIKRLEIGVKG